MNNATQQTQYRIFSRSEALLSDAGWWSNTDGWTVESNATLFNESEKENFSLPVAAEDDAGWRLYEERDQLYEICQGAAAAIFTSINSENFYEDGYLALSEQLDENEDEFPDDFCAWHPFENESPGELLEIIEDEARFIYAVVSKTLETIEEQLKEKGVNLKGLKLKNLAVRETLIT